MASPAMLRGVFGRSFKGWHIPDEVLEEIFKFGFHLWLAIPCDIDGVLEEEEIHGRPIFSRLWTTRTGVPREFLTADAQRLVEYRKYVNSLKLPWILRPARPRLLRCSFRMVRTFDITGSLRDYGMGEREWAIENDVFEPFD